MAATYNVGVDIGSTTVKLVVLPAVAAAATAADAQQGAEAACANPRAAAARAPVFMKYVKHFSDIKNAVVSILNDVNPGSSCKIAITGSGGLNVSKSLGTEFVQEVIACTEAVETLAPTADVAIELGGEDAKITYFSERSPEPGAPPQRGALEQRMNGTCAGGTGSFIDQMAILLKTDSPGLNQLAAGHKMIYPIASRCGVFAKTDIQPLLNEGASREDVAASVLQAVVNQTIGGLACGKPIRGRVVFLGGPLHFLDQLRQRFIETLKLTPDCAIVPQDSHYFVAIGSALLASRSEAEPCAWDDFFKRVPLVLAMDREEAHLPPMFASPEDYAAFRERHASHKVGRAELAEASGDCYLGIDSGSTTTKIALIDSQGRLLYSSYGPNQGSPLFSTIAALRELYAKMPPAAHVGRSCVTGYGEALIKTALRVDAGEIETLAHYRAAESFQPGLTFVIDIGGQDMKSMRIRNGGIDSIMLNEACSSGCGSFVSAFAQSLNMPVEEFARAGVQSASPVDLGTRCTVFMNSRVKQAQKEGACIADISGGIALSIIKNALFKVIRMRSPEEMGEHIVVQGGTFYNDAVLRAFEKVSGREVVRPDIAGIMGAFGAALIARSQHAAAPEARSTMLGADELAAFKCETTTRRCGKCQNNCLLTVNTFGAGGQFISGNRCERGAGADEAAVAKAREQVLNMYAWKAKRVFRYAPLAPAKATRGDIGIPRVLNMYEDYPFWHTFFTQLGFRVLLSTPSTKATFERGMETIPSDTICYPAKLVHGHIEELVRRGLKKVFYPCVPYNTKEDPQSLNCFNCPVVGTYPEVIRANCDFKDGAVQFLLPFLPIDAPSRMATRLLEELSAPGVCEPRVSRREVERAAEAAYAALAEYKAEVRAKGEEALRDMRDKGTRAIVLAGRPYHVDPEINHGVPEILCANGFAVISEDGVAHLGRALAHRDRLRVVDQWTYHSRLYAAARLVAQTERLDMLQLVSFGCGLDAVTTDQVKEIIEGAGKLYTSLKIDEINNLGAARIRIRSMIAVILERARKPESTPAIPGVPGIPGTSAQAQEHAGRAPAPAPVPAGVFPKNARRAGWTLLLPQFSPFHMDLLAQCLTSEGYKPKVLRDLTRDCIDEGLRWVHNDACFPAICVIGQLMRAIKSGDYDQARTALVITQTGGCCRATNYVAFLRKALCDSGLAHVPVISVNAYGLDPQPGFELSKRLLLRGVTALFWGDFFMQLVSRTRPYEAERGSVAALHAKWEAAAMRQVNSGSRREMRRIAREAVAEFDAVALRPDGDAPEHGRRRPRVGIVGEIMVKLAADANNRVVDFLEREGAESVTHGLTDFCLYCAYDHVVRHKYLSGPLSMKVGAQAVTGFVEALRGEINGELERSRRFHAPQPIVQLAKETSRLVSLCNMAGEGWYLIGEILSMYHSGVKNILLLQPFGCLPNHIMGRGMVRLLRRELPDLNIAAVDYDPGASEINQINRVKLMLTVAKRRLEHPADPVRADSSPSVAATSASDCCASPDPQQQQQRAAGCPVADIEAIGDGQQCSSCSLACTSRPGTAASASDSTCAAAAASAASSASSPCASGGCSGCSSPDRENAEDVEKMLDEADRAHKGATMSPVTKWMYHKIYDSFFLRGGSHQ
eukprot:m51a1_g2590 hypothetical protein (1635) ;mRNA; f:425243-430816